MIDVNYNIFPHECLSNYLEFLVGKMYKILPIFENEPSTLKNYLESLLVELKGNQILIEQIRYDADFARLLGTIQYFISENCDHKIYKREVFKCINIIKSLQKKYFIKVGE